MPNPTKSLTTATLAKLKATDTTQWHTDARQPGLQISVTPKGTKTWYFLKKIGGKPKREKIGRYPAISTEDARRIVRQKLREVERGDYAGGSITFGKAFHHWLESYAKKAKRTWPEDERKFNTVLQPIAEKRLREIKAADIDAIHQRVGSRYPYAANRALSLMTAVFNHSIRHPDIEFEGRNPCVSVKPYPEEPRSRVLSSQEMGQFLSSLEQEPPLWKDFFTTLLFTGARLENVKAMRWSQLDLDNQVWDIPASSIKSKRATRLALNDRVAATLVRRKGDAKNDWVFPSNAKPYTHISDIKKAWARICKRAGIENLRRHDLRRSLGTWLAEDGASTFAIEKTLGLSTGSKAAKHYVHIASHAAKSIADKTIQRMTGGGQ